MKAAHPHKSWQVLMLYIRPVIVRALWREWIHDAREKGRGDDEWTVSEFNKWLAVHPRQLIVNFFALRSLPALHCVRAGVRHNIPRMFTAGRKALLPELYARGAMNYGPAAGLAIHWALLVSAQLDHIPGGGGKENRK